MEGLVADYPAIR
jgi:arginine decarboxylase